MIMKEGNQTMFQFFRRRLRNERGFTLIELLIVVAIIAILAAILIPTFLLARAQSQVGASNRNLKNLATALESYFVDKASYPLAITDLGTGQAYLRAIPPDPCTNKIGRASSRERVATAEKLEPIKNTPNPCFGMRAGGYLK